MANYIEFRVYLKDGELTTPECDEIIEAAESIRDLLTDELDPATGALETFTQDVTYEVHLNRAEKK